MKTFNNPRCTRVLKVFYSKMKLRIDKEPKVDELEFFTRQRDYAESTSPRSITMQRGLEFDHFRTYQQDDDASLIDWKASARSGEILVRVYSEDISLKILLVLDVSESMIYGTGKKAKIEFAIELAINLAYGSIAYGDSVGLLLFNNGVVGTVPFGSKKEQFFEITETLLNTESYGGGVDLEYTLSMIMQLFKGTHIMIMISDFLGFGGSFFPDMHAVLDQFDILGIMVHDKTDVILGSPLLYLNMADPFSDSSAILQTPRLEKMYKEANEERISRLDTFFSSANKDFWVFNTDDSIETKLPRLLEQRNGLRR